MQVELTFAGVIEDLNSTERELFEAQVLAGILASGGGRNVYAPRLSKTRALCINITLKYTKKPCFCPSQKRS